jgi:tetratricopeptide (TPR) repeat protein
MQRITVPHEIPNLVARLQRHDESPNRQAPTLHEGLTKEDFASLQLKALDLARGGAYAEARFTISRALAINPLNARTHFLAGRIAEETLDFESAALHYGCALELDPKNEKFQFHVALNCFSRGRFGDGADLYRSRPSAAQHPDPLVCGLPRWRGEVMGGRILLWAEQGLGDEILFLRMLPLIKAHWSRLLVEVDPRLKPVYEHNFPDIGFIDRGLPVQASDLVAQAPHGDLLSLFHRRITDPQLVGHRLAVPGGHQQAQKALRNAFDGKQSVGISWLTMSTVHPLMRSIPVQTLLQALSPKTHVLVNLQYLAPAEDLDLIERAGFTLINRDEVDGYQDLVGLASLIAGVDKVLTIDNATAHLAGTLGADTVVLLPHLANWRWGRPGACVSWYPELRTFWQASRGDWSSTVAAAKTELRL